VSSDFDDPERLADLNRSPFMDPDARPTSSPIAAIARRVLDAAIATVSFIDATKRWHGEVAGCSVADADHVFPFCDVTIKQPDLLVVPDITKDGRFDGPTFVTGRRRVRFYAGAAIVTADGRRVGAVNVLGFAPRFGLTEGERETLHNLAALAARQWQADHVAAPSIPAVAAGTASERESHDRDASFRLMFEDNPLPMLLYDPAALTITQVNHAVLTAFGYSRDNLLQRQLLDLLPEEEQIEARAFIAALYDQPANSAWTYLRANGERVRVQVITHPFSVAGRRQRLAVIWDVTEVEYARDALRQSNQELLVLAGQLQARTADLTEVNRRARLGMWRLPPDGSPAEWSDEMFEVFGRPAGQMGPDFAELLTWIAPGDRTRVHDIVRRTADQRTAHSFEFRAVQPNGSIRHCLADLRPEFGFGNRLIALKGFCQDVTERKETELALLRSEKLKTIGQFTGGVAHDFNNLLTVMMLNVEEAIDALPPDHEIQPLLGPVLHAAMRGSELTSQLLSYARRSPLEPMHVSLQDLFNGLSPLLDRILGDRFTLAIHHGEDSVQPFVDAAKLENALLNLVINARDAMTSGGQITIRTSVATLGPRDAGNWTDFLPGQYVLISVSDSGCGIPPDIFPRVFEPFFTTKAVGKGSGLGLSMVYGFAKQSGGHVAMTSTVNIGTTATLYLPLHGSHDATAQRSAKGGSRAIAQRMVALLVEDQPDVLETVQRQLLALGFKVIVAADAARAMDHITANSIIDLLFSDVAIPGPIDGTQLASIARQRHPEVRVLLTSGYLDHTVPRAVELAPDIEFLQKPYSRVELTERLANMFPAVEPDGD
jgi:PAS domain S-box-containing protein